MISAMKENRPADTLGMSEEEFRKLGYWMVDRVIAHCKHSPDGPAIRADSHSDLMKALGGPVPEEPSDAMEAMTLLADVALANQQHGDHPRYFARVPGPSSFAGILGDWISTGFNGMAASWGGGAGTTTAEIVVCRWLAEEFGFKPDTDGVLCSGGSIANLIALVTARAEIGDGVAYLSEQAHSSIERDLKTIGMTYRLLPTERDLRVSLPALEAAIAKDKQAGLKPAVIIGSAGTTNSGTVDDLPALSKIARREAMWFHVDGAYGAPAALCDEGRKVMPGLDLVDSLVLDPHKWLFQPYDMGVVLVQRSGALERTFTMHPEYLKDITGKEREEVDMRDRTLELSRRARALKLWLTIRVYGMKRIREGLARGIWLAEEAEKILRADARWEIVTPAQLGIVTFAIKNAKDGEHAARADAITKDGYAALTSSSLLGRPILRLCTINPRTTVDDIRETLNRTLAIELP